MSHLFFTALKASFAEGYSLQKFRADLLAGLSVGLVSIPFVMALAIASGVPPQHGLYTGMVAGFLAALFGGSRFNITGPTAAFVLLLLPVAQEFGLGGLFTASFLAGILMIILAFTGLGTLVRYLPYPVILGFTSGIGLVIVFLQLPDFFGFNLSNQPQGFLERITLYLKNLSQWQWQETLLATVTLLLLWLTPRLKFPLPAPLLALAFGTFLAWLLAYYWPNLAVETIASRFAFTYPDGSVGQGIPPFLPQWHWPWFWLDAEGKPMTFNLDLLRALSGAVFGLVALASIEALLCATVADQVSGKKHQANGELLGQGIGNVIAPFFGGFMASASLSRTLPNIQAGAHSPFAAMTHALVLLLAIVLLAPFLAWVPMAVLAALMVMVGLQVAKLPLLFYILRRSPANDVLVLLTGFILTIVFNMVTAVAVGLLLSAFLFIKQLVEQTSSKKLPTVEPGDTPPWLAIIEIEGALFFGVADKVSDEVLKNAANQSVAVLILDLSHMPFLDVSGLLALEKMLQRLEQQKIAVVFSGVSRLVFRQMFRFGLKRKENVIDFAQDLATARLAASVLWSKRQQLEKTPHLG
jgi:SulP family sulfate permease